MTKHETEEAEEGGAGAAEARHMLSLICVDGEG